MSIYDSHPDDPFPIDPEPFEIDSQSGRIGRIYWDNQETIRGYVFPTDQRVNFECPGACTLVETWGQWRAYLLDRTT
jgi:hypothetical protein